MKKTQIITMKIYIDSDEIKFIKVNGDGKITKTGLPKEYKDFDRTYVDMKSIKVGEYPVVSFNKFILKDKAVWTKLNYKITKIN